MTTNPPSLTKRWFRALGKVFVAEIEGRNTAFSGRRLPFQSQAKVYRELADAGLVQSVELQLRGRFRPVTVQGWELTGRGLHAYCMNCPEIDDGEA